MQLSPKQKEFWNRANHRWNIKYGATRSGKTYLDYYMIPRRIMSCTGTGLIVIMGVTKNTVERNVLEPMRNMYGGQLVGNISSNNTVTLFGKHCHVLGAEKANAISKVQGAGIEYCYGDEVTNWSPEVFEMLKSRLDKPNSVFDGTCNPAGPNHWFKQFIDSDTDIFAQHYTIDDNPFLSPQFVEALKKEYYGKVQYKRYILGMWALAEGLIYTNFANDVTSFLIPAAEAISKKYDRIFIGEDFGGNKSRHAFVASGLSDNFTAVTVLKARCVEANGTDVDYITRQLDRFCREIIDKYGRVDVVFADSAEQAIINQQRKNLPYRFKNSVKNQIIDRIRTTDMMMGSHRLRLVDGECGDLIDGLSTAVWDDTKKDDTRLDDGTTNIDILDAFEYSWEYYIRRLSGERARNENAILSGTKLQQL